MAHVGEACAMGYDWPDGSPFATDDPRYRPISEQADTEQGGV